MEIIILLALAAPVVLTIWLAGRVIRAGNEITELSRRVNDLQAKIAHLQKAGPPPVQPETPPAATAISPPIAPPPIISQPPIQPKSKPIAETLPTTAQAAPAPEKSSFEMRVGTYWLVRVGVVMLLTGLAFFANYAYHHIIGRLGPSGKISLLYLASGLLLGVGAWWQRRNVKESLKNYAQVLFAGGLAAVYFTTYAAYHIPPLRVISNAVVDGMLLLAWAGVIAWIADRRKSEVMALFAVGLAFFTSVITRVGEFTLYSNLILTIAAVVFLVRNRWVTLSFASLVTSYTGYAFWRFLHTDGWRWAALDENLGLGAGFLACYWLAFTAATFLSRSEKLSGSNRAAFLTLNNGAFFGLFLLTMIQVHTGGFWKFSLGFGGVLLVLAGLARQFLPDEPIAKNSNLTQGLLLVTLGFISKFTGLQLVLVLGVESVVLFVLGTQQQSAVLKFFGGAVAAIATGWCVAEIRRNHAPSLGTGASLIVLLAFNAFWANRQETGNPKRLRAEPMLFTLLAVLVSLVWIGNVLPARQYVWAYMAAAIPPFALALWRRNGNDFVAPAVFVFASFVALWGHDGLEMEVYWPNLLALLIPLAMQQIFRRAGANIPIDEKIHGAIILVTGASLWRFATCWITTSGIFLTMSWAGFAVIAFALGMFLRERFYRWLGLGVLAAAVGRVVLVDVWKQETIWRVVTFMALGMALLVVGFVYNKYQDAIRKWL
ncbi:MAG: DUF2339 domain-containing protein [Verrucomicrobiota bacterium]